MAAAKIQHESGDIVVLDLGGADEVLENDGEILKYVDFVSPNETEIQKIFGMDYKNPNPE